MCIGGTGSVGPQGHGSGNDQLNRCIHDLGRGGGEEIIDIQLETSSSARFFECQLWRR